MSDIDIGVLNAKVVSFADDTRLYSKISYVEDCDSLQSDLNCVYDWAKTNSMVFNSPKFKYLSFSTNVSITSYYVNVYVSPHLKDLGIIMYSNCSFEQHIIELCKRCTGLCGWILRTFSSRESTVMMTLFKSLVLSRLDYGSQLWSPTKIHQIIMIEKIQKAFTKHIKGFSSFSYQERLSNFKIYSLQRRRERYIIMYVFKILENLVPNLVKPLQFYVSDRRGRLCSVSHVRLGHTGSLAYSSFRWKGIRMFNSLPMHIRNITACPPSVFKKQLDLHLSPMLDCYHVVANAQDSERAG